MEGLKAMDIKNELETLLNHYQMKETDEIIRESQELINWLKRK